MRCQTPFNLLFSCLILLAYMGCAEDSSNPSAATIIATEVWEFIMDDDSSNYGETTFEKKSNGSIVARANWHFLYGDVPVECPFENGTVTLADTLMSILANGTATNSYAPPGFQNSTFTLNADGQVANGHSSGLWNIAFSTLGWPASVQGSFLATRKSGSGITP
jgi:hypothetical protein